MEIIGFLIAFVVLNVLLWAGEKTTKEIKKNNYKKRQERLDQERISARHHKLLFVCSTKENLEKFLREDKSDLLSMATHIRYTKCWCCGERLSSATHQKCPDCGWLICTCSACSPHCSREKTNVGNEIRTFAYYAQKEKKTRNYYFANIDILFEYLQKNLNALCACVDDASASWEFTSAFLFSYIQKNEKEIFGFDEDGYDQSGFNIDGYNREGFDKTGYDSEGYAKDGYSRYGYDKNGYDRDGKNIRGYRKDGYNDEGYDIYGYSREGYNRDGYDENGYDRQGYDINGYNKKGYDINGFNRRGVDKEGYNRLGYDINGYNRFGYNKNGRDKEGYDQEGFDCDGYNRRGYDKYGYNKYGYNQQGFNKDGKYSELVGKEVIDTSYGRGVVANFYNEDNKNYFVVRFENKRISTFLFSKKVLTIMTFINYDPNFDE